MGRPHSRNVPMNAVLVDQPFPDPDCALERRLDGEGIRERPS
jgi:hypothetical protein